MAMSEEERKAKKREHWQLYYFRNKDSINQRKRDRRDENPDYHAQYSRKYRIENPERIKAKDAVKVAIKKGKLKPASELTCERCGEQAQELHHPDYTKPLAVQALCRSCHKLLHADLDRLAEKHGIEVDQLLGLGDNPIDPATLEDL